ncbi:hypothetical protein DQ239_10105 [Blastococcus sp. TF02-09]|uniref:hypothetical protein n=1 Tax=Blastococcus sp. TF02-09 TaxID=2250576 RepID=UPI000DEA64B8|nr:hypothetical protein [Blastococcus sp. TF02-9]RBY78039.1 hypothetical protein DQ239_10105 [Blastococcus sp. TF02-9]
MRTAVGAVLAAEQQLPEDIGKAGPLGLLLIVVLLIAVAALVRSMSRHLRKVPRSFDPDDAVPEVPDTPAELVEPAPGAELLDTLRRQPRAIEARRDDDDRPGSPASQS